MEQDKYTYVQAGDQSIEHYYGLILWAMIREEIWPMTKVSTNDLKTQPAELSFTNCNTSVPTLITKMLDIKCQIEAEKGNIYDTDHFMTLFFTKLSTYNNEMFCYQFISSCSNYNKGAMTMQEVFEALKMVYKSEQAAGTWSNLISTKHEITMLTTTLNKTKTELDKLKSSGHGGGRGTGVDKGGRGAGRGNHGGGGRGSGGGRQSQEDRAWMLVKTTNTIKHPTEGYDMKWCKCADPVATKGLPKACISVLPMTTSNGFSTNRRRTQNLRVKRNPLSLAKQRLMMELNPPPKKMTMKRSVSN
jgi:hypothetical protein